MRPFSVLELFHGPTCAFKDIALCVLPHLMTAAKKVLTEKQGAPAPLLHILTATSGDTGKAALAGFKDVPGTMITVFYPHGGISDMQRLQMVTQPGNNVCAAGILGSFDDAQTGVKNLFTDESLKKELAEKDIYQAMLCCAELTARHLRAHGQDIHPRTLNLISAFSPE